MTATFSTTTWSPRTVWNFAYIREGALIGDAKPDLSGSQSPSAEDLAELRIWRHSLALVVDTLGRRFPDALAAVREALLRARETQSGPYSPDVYEDEVPCAGG